MSVHNHGTEEAVVAKLREAEARTLTEEERGFILAILKHTEELQSEVASLRDKASLWDAVEPHLHITGNVQRVYLGASGSMENPYITTPREFASALASQKND